MTLGQKRDWKKPIKGKEKAPFKQSRIPPQKGGRGNETTRFKQRGSTGLAHLMGFANPPLASKLLEGAAKKVVL